MEPKYPPDAFRGFRAFLPDFFIGSLLRGELQRAVDLLQLQPEDCVCDAACGPGYNIARLVRAVGPEGLVVAVEDNPHLLARAEEKVRRGGWTNVRLLRGLDPEQIERKPFDGITVGLNPPIFLQRPDLLGIAWGLLKPGGRFAVGAGRCTTLVGRIFGPSVKIGLKLLGHPADWHYWTVHEPWKHLEQLAAGKIWVEPRLLGFTYILSAEKPP